MGSHLIGWKMRPYPLTAYDKKRGYIMYRTCLKCGKRLAIYNKTNFCFCHQQVPMMMPTNQRRNHRSRVQRSIPDFIETKKYQCQEEKALHIFVEPDRREVDELLKKMEVMKDKSRLSVRKCCAATG